MYMYNNFSSKKTKKVISALLASALVVTSGPITADAATAKVVGIKKTFTVSASATNKVTGLSKAEKKVVKVTKKGKKFTIKGLKAGKATFKIGKKSYTVKVGATTVKAAKTKLTLTKGKAATLKFTTKSGNGDTLTFKASNKNVTLAKKSAKIAKSAASVKATAKKAGKTTITATSKATGKKATVTVTVKGATKTTATPANTATPEVTATATVTGSATNTPEATGAATTTPEVTNTPEVTSGAATATPEVTNTPEVTGTPVVTDGSITVNVTASGAALTGANIQVLSGTSVVASVNNSITSSYITAKLTNGTYTVVVTKDGYVTATKSIVVNGDVKVDVDLQAVNTVEISSINAYNLNKYTDKYETLELNSKLPTNARISVKFSSVMNTDTVNINTVKLYETDGNIPAGVAKVTFNKTKTIATIIPASLKKNTSYKLVFTSTIASETNKKLAQTEYTFKTSSEGVLDAVYCQDGNTAASLNQLTINSDVYNYNTSSNYSAAEKDDVYYISLDSVADAGSINSDTVRLRNVTDNTTVNIRAELVAQDTSVSTTTFKKNKAIKVTLLDNLKMKKNYRFEVNGVRLANGGEVTSIVFPFVTESAAPTFTANQTLNGTALGAATTEDAAVRVNGKLEAVNLPTINTPEAGFGLIYNMSSVTDNKTVTADAFALTDITNNKNIPFNFSYDETLKQVKIIPTENLPENAVVKITTSVDYKIKNVLGLSMPEKEYFVKSYDLTAPTVTSVEGDTTNLKVGVQHKIKVNFSEEIGYGAGTIITDADLAASAVTSVGDKLDGNNCIALVKAGVNPTEALAAGDFIKIDSVKRSENKKSIEIKFTPATTDIGKSFQLVIAGKNDENRKFICDFANGTGAAQVANPLASDYKVTLTTELQDVTGPEVEAIGTIDDADITKVNDDSKFKAFTDGAHNVDETKDIAIRFNEQLTLVGTTFNTATGQANADGNVVLEKYNFTTNKWDKVDTTMSTKAGVVVDSVAKKDALYIKKSVIHADSKYRLTISPSVNDVNVIKDKATDPNTMGTKYTVEFTTGKVNGLSNLSTLGTVVTDVTNALTTNGLAAASAGTTQITNKTANEIDNVGGAGHILAIELADGSFMFTTQVGATDISNDKITINDALTSSIKEGAKLYDLTVLTDGILAQYATGVEKDEPILVKVTSNTEELNADTIKDAVKLYKTSDNSVVDADVKYYIATGAKNTAWVSINPKADLEASTNYYVKADGLKDRLGNEQDADSKKKVLSFKTASEKKKASVSDFNIYDGQMNVGVKTAFTFTAKDVDSFDKSKVTLKTTSGNVPVSADVKYDSTTGVVTLTPNVPLAKQTGYTLTVAVDAFNKDGNGENMDDPATTIGFQTGDAVKPAIKSVKHIEAGGSGLVGDRIVITLDSEVDDATFKSLDSEGGSLSAADFTAAFSFENGQITAGGIASVALSGDKKTITVVYGNDLEPGDYISDGYTTIKAVSLQATGSNGSDDLVFGDGRVTIEK